MPDQGKYIGTGFVDDEDDEPVLKKLPAADVVSLPKNDVTTIPLNPTIQTLSPAARQAGEPEYIVKKNDKTDNYFNNVNQFQELYVNRGKREKILTLNEIIKRPTKELKDFLPNPNKSKEQKIMDAASKVFDNVFNRVASEIPIQKGVDEIIGKLKF